MRILAPVLSSPILLATAICVGIAPPADAILFPVVTDIHITSCSTYTRPDGYKVPCADSVYYAGNTSILEIGPPTNLPLPNLPLESLGIHCSSSWAGANFKTCSWTRVDHSPGMYDCTLSTDGTWNLTNPLTCRFSSTWGGHQGAGPGGECVVYGQLVSSATVNTPFGAIDATQAANAGASRCLKPLPPNTPCIVQLGADMDHGVMPPHGQNSVSARGSLDCGASPNVTLVGPSELPLGEGVTTHITVSTPSQNEIVVTSDMTTVGARPGTYTAHAVIAVSPQ